LSESTGTKSALGPLFKLGQVVATPDAINALKTAQQGPQGLLARHAQGDWGVLEEEDREANDRALIEGSRIFSAYLTTDGIKIWVITEADRSSTCILLPSEY